MSRKRVATLACAAIMAGGLAARAQAVVIFSDNFNQPDGNLDTSQTSQYGGLLASTVTVQSQQVVHLVSNHNVVFQNGGQGTSSIRFNNQYDWASGTAGAAITAAGGMDINFDWTPNDASGNWISWATGVGVLSSQYDQPYEITLGSTDNGVLIRNNQGAASFVNGSATTGPGFSSSLTTHNVDIAYYFNSWAIGSPVSMVTTVDGTVAATASFTWSHSLNYQELATNDPGEKISNLVISTVPEPTSFGVIAVGSLGMLARRRKA